IAAVWFAANTPSGRLAIEQAAYDLTAGQVRLIGLDGSLPAKPSLGELELADGTGVWLVAERISVSWSIWSLLSGRIHVTDLKIAKLRIDRAPVASGKGGKVSVPRVDVDGFRADEVNLGAALIGKPARVSAQGHLVLRSLEDADAAIVARREDGPGEYAVRLRFDRRRMDGSLTVHEPAGGPLAALASLPELGPLAFSMTVEGPRSAAHVALAVEAGPLQGRASGTVDLLHEAAVLEYSLEAPAMAPRPDVRWTRIALKGNWRGSLSAPAANGTLAIDALSLGDSRVRHLEVALSARAGSLELHSTVAGLEVPGPQPRLLADALLRIDAAVQLAKAGKPYELTAIHPLFTMRAHGDAVAGSNQERRVDLDLALSTLSPFAALVNQDVKGAAALKAQVAYGPFGGSVNADAKLGISGGEAGIVGLLGANTAIQMAATVTGSAFKVQSLRMASNGITLDASGSAVRGTAGAKDSFIKNLQTRWQLAVADVSVFAKGVAGELKAVGNLAGPLDSLSVNADVSSTLSVNGSPSGPVDVVLHARGLPGAPSASLQAHGTVDSAPLTVDAALDRNELHETHIRVHQADWKSAHVDADVAANAAFNQSHGQVHFTLGQLSDFDRLLGTHLAGNVRGTVVLVPDPRRTRAQLTIDGAGLVVGQFAGELHLKGGGTSDALGLQLTGQLPQLYGSAATLSAAAVINGDGREARIDNVAAAYRGETLKLLAPAHISFKDGIGVDRLKFGARAALIEVAGRITPALDVRADVSHVEAPLINAFAPGLLAAGTLSAQARLNGAVAAPTGTVRVDASGLQFADDAATGFPPVEIHAAADLANERAAIQAALTAGTGSEVTLTGSAPLAPNGALDLKIGGKLDVGLANPVLEARGLHTTGALALQATVTGSATAPRVGGGIKLSAGSLRDYTRGINLTDIDAEVVGNEAALEIKTFRAKAASGSVTMTGTLGVLQHGMPVDFKITARNAQPVASSILTGTLDADIRIVGTALERLDVAGTVHVNRATIGIPDSLPPEVAVLEVRRRGRPAAVPGSKRLVIGIDVAIQAPREILVQGRGLDAELGGEIKLSGTTDELVAGGGFDLLRGNFTINGTKLNFTEGRVGFDGAGLRRKIDPTLDFTARAAVAETSVTLRITGAADAPRFDFSSSPSLPQDEIMALLLFGVKESQLTA
ncbi:MAG: translocation/assembly module TamB domain-containing protein, partial [Pseudomonadota bacterium]|nr:translocation/assembly module TamB domain-containing protein [Pseudomonadota bacterium]